MAVRAAVLPFKSGAEIDAAIPLVLSHLRHDLLIAYPTETTYGLGSRIAHHAVDRLAALKGRTDDKPFLLLVDGIGMLDAAGIRLPATATRLATRFWPGPLTLVLPVAARLERRLVSGQDGRVAVRWTSHAGALRIIAALGEPITSTSANRPGLPPAVTAGEILTEWEGEVARGELQVLDGGALSASLPSTVVDCSGNVPHALRLGAISLGALREADPDLVGEL